MTDDHATILDFPLAGPCWVIRPPGHGRWAFDVLPGRSGSHAVADGGWWHYLGCRLRSRDVAGWEREVRSPLDGRVVSCHDGEPDQDRLVPWRDVPAGLLLRPLLKGRQIAAMAGNHVIIAGSGTHVLLAHLRRGSLAVEQGQTVRAGQLLGRVGSSGNALGPHLHLQTMDSPDPLRARPAPFAVRHMEVFTDGDWHGRDGDPLPPARSLIRARGGDG